MSTKAIGENCRRCGQPRPQKRTYCKACFAEYMRLRREGNLHPFGGYRPPTCKQCGAAIKPQEGLCKACKSKYLREYNQRPEVKARHRELSKLPEVRARKQREYAKWNLAHPGKSKEFVARWAAANRAKKNATERARRAANIEESRRLSALHSATWKKRNPEKNRAINHAMKAARRKAVGQFTAFDLVALDIKQEGICALCSKSYDGKYSVDHIIPLALVGKDSHATNWPSNLQLTHLRCNMLKNARLITSLP